MKKTLFVRFRVEQFDDKDTDKNVEKVLAAGFKKAIAGAGFEAASVEVIEFTGHAVPTA
jgi:hypothetical protein